MPAPSVSSVSSPAAAVDAGTEWVIYAAETSPETAASGLPVPRLPLAFEPWLFTRPTHQVLQADGGGRVLGVFLENVAEGRTTGVFYVRLDAENHAAHSPGQAPFGGLQMAVNQPFRVVNWFVAGIENELLNREIRRLSLRPPAFVYAPAVSALQAEVLRQRGYSVALAEQNYALNLRLPYAAHLHPSERRRLVKCGRHGLHFEQEPPLLLPLAHAFIAACRAERGQAPPLPLARLQTLFQQFPRDHFLFSVRQPNGEWAALTVAIRVDARVLYNFYPASPLRCNAFSPAVLLTEGLHHFARVNNFEILDLGTSTLPTGPNASLLRFKRHLGATAGLRLTWEKELKEAVGDWSDESPEGLRPTNRR